MKLGSNSRLGINFFRRLSEPSFYLLKRQFPCTLIFKNGQPACENQVVQKQNHVGLDKWTTFNVTPWKLLLIKFIWKSKKKISSYIDQGPMNQLVNSLMPSNTIWHDITWSHWLPVWHQAITLIDPEILSLKSSLSESSKWTNFLWR